ncbi:MAG: AI-2E family transporter [Anaerolineae bacterium]|nr:AI-2E family transporter [Anaerolineae bacterium]
MGQLPVSSPYGATTRWVLLALAIVIFLASLWFIRGILLLILAAIILVILFTTPIRSLVKRGVPHGWATLISVVLVVTVIVLLIAIVLPSLTAQFGTLLGDTVPRGINELIARLEDPQLQEQFAFLANINLQDTINALGSQLANAVSQIGASVLPVLGGVANTLLSILIVIFLSMYFLSDPNMHQEGLVRLLPVWYRERAREIIREIDATLRGWLRATLASMIFAGVATGVLLALLGIEQSIALGVLAGVLSFVPNFGPIIALIPSVAAGIVEVPGSVLWIVVIIYGVSFVQSQIITPILVSDTIKIPPVLILLGQIIAGVFFGFLGIMLAVPMTAILTVLVKEIYVKDVLGDSESFAPTTTFRDEVLADEA